MPSLATQRHLMLAVTMGFCITSGAGCERQTTTTTGPNTTTTTTTVTPAPRVEKAVGKAAEALSDVTITASVKAALLADPDVKGSLIDVDTRDGVVTLNGVVERPGNVDRAATLARGVTGVKSVDNKLTVKAPG